MKKLIGIIGSIALLALTFGSAHAASVVFTPMPGVTFGNQIQLFSQTMTQDANGNYTFNTALSTDLTRDYKQILSMGLMPAGPIAVTVATLPTCSAALVGMRRAVTDSTTIAAEGQTCVGSSTHKAVAECLDANVWKCF